MKIFIDLDGTLLDSKPRLYYLFQFLVPDSTLSFQDYWNLKQDKITNNQILANFFKYKEKDIIKFNNKWMSLIEEPQWIEYDKPHEGVEQFLDNLRQNNELYIVTARQSKDVVLMQFNSFGMNYLFKDILVTLQKTTKYNLIRSITSTTPQDWIIGDTGKDIETGKLLGIKTTAVLNGFLSKNQLEKYAPDLIFDSIIHFNIK